LDQERVGWVGRQDYMINEVEALSNLDDLSDLGYL
jgi:hypothetical protein